MFLFMPDFGAAVRTLTSFGTGAMAPANVPVTTLAAATSVDLRTGGTQLNELSIAVKTGGTATALTSINIWDGTTALVAAQTAAAANSPAYAVIYGNPTRGPRLTNTDGAVAATYIYTGIALQP